MTNIILQIIVFQWLFLAIYDLFLQKETFFNWNRLYLLVTPVISLILPFVKIPIVTDIAVKYQITTLPEIFINSENTKVVNTFWSYSYIELFFGIGVAVMLLLFMVKLANIYRLIKTNNTIKKEDYTLVILTGRQRAFSFFNYIFTSKKLLEKEKLQIISHELIHCKSYHSIDLLLFELLKIAMWFNPLIYVFQNRIQLLHEYIADEKTIKMTTSKQYFNQLLSEVFEVEHISFINQFYKQSFLKKRIIMATKNKSKQVKKAKYLAIIPLLMAMVFYVSCNGVGQEKPKTTTEKADVKKEGDVSNVYMVKEELKKGVKERVETEEFPFAFVENAPVFPGCKGNKEEVKKCLEKEIKNHITKEFNIDLASNLGLSKGKKRISVLFKIDKTGNVVDIQSRAPHKVLEEEAIRVVKRLPKMKPATTSEGKEVNVKYALPIVFMVE